MSNLIMSVGQLLAFLVDLKKANSDLETFNALKGVLFNHQLDAKYDFEVVEVDGVKIKKIKRLLITLNKTKKVVSSLSYKCNGIIIDFNTMRVLAMPLPNRSGNVSRNESYEIYKMYDGSVINLYYYDSVWCMGSSKGIDIRRHKWLTDLTYGEAFDQVFNGYESLDKTHGYTFVFKNNAFHPFKDENYAIMLSESNGETVKNVQAKVGVSVADAIHHNNSYVYNGKDKHYGYIFRNETSTCYWESSLMKSIRTHVYNMPKPVKDINDPSLRKLYSVLRAYMTHSSDFLTLFPQYTQDVEEIRDLFECVLKGIMQSRRFNINIKIKNITKYSKKTVSDLVTLLCDDFVSKLNPFTEDTISIVRDHILVAKNVMEVFGLLIADTPSE